MRKLALLLGSLVVVASASAKEVVPAPVVVEEAPVQIVEKEVIVYRDKEEGFRPNGNVDLQYRYYGETEGQDGEKATDWNTGDNRYSRTQLSGAIQMTEAQKLEFRVRDWNSLKHGETDPDSEIRLRYFYNHGNLGDSKVNFTSRIQYRDREDEKQDIEYMAKFNFAEYMFNNDFVKTTDFTVAPRYAYVWDAKDNYENQLGVDLYTFHELPLGLSAEFNVYTTQSFFEEDQAFDGGRKQEDKNFAVDVEAYLYHSLPLYSNDKLSIAFNNEGGYDQYNWSKEKQFGERKDGKDKYSVYLLSTIGVDYQATPNVTLYAAAGAEYRNWKNEHSNCASDWRWQPTAWAGFKTTF